MQEPHFKTYLMRTTIVKNVRNLFQKQFMVRVPKNSADLEKDLGLNRFEMNELFDSIEHLFKIQLEDEETQSIHTVKDLVYCVERKQHAL